MDTSTMEQEIRAVLAGCAQLARPAAEVDGDADLFELGLTSFSSVSVMLTLEDRFEVEFPDHLLKRDTFRTVRNLCAAIASLATAA